MSKISQIPRLSVIIPCFNKSGYLIEMLKCIKNQTFTDWELFLIDDGSEESEYLKVHNFVSDDSRISHFKRNRPPKNGDTCRNIGMELACGEYVIIFDSDDQISETCFENRVKFMDEHPNCDYATFPYASYEEGAPLPASNVKDKMGVDNKTILKELLSTNYPFTVWANIYRNAAIKNIRWDEDVFVYQDFDFMVQCDIAGLKHIYADVKCSDYFYCHFNSGNSVCNNFSEKKLISTNYLFKKIFKIIESRNDKDDLLKSFERFLTLHFERLLNEHQEGYLEEYYDLITPYVPIIANKCRQIHKKIGTKTQGHFNQARIHYLLYKSFNYKFNKVMCYHELAKCLLRR